MVRHERGDADLDTLQRGAERVDASDLLGSEAVLRGMTRHRHHCCSSYCIGPARDIAIFWISFFLLSIIIRGVYGSLPIDVPASRPFGVVVEATPPQRRLLANRSRLQQVQLFVVLLQKGGYLAPIDAWPTHTADGEQQAVRSWNRRAEWKHAITQMSCHVIISVKRLTD